MGLEQEFVAVCVRPILAGLEKSPLVDLKSTPKTMIGDITFKIGHAAFRFSYSAAILTFSDE